MAELVLGSARLAALVLDARIAMPISGDVPPDGILHWHALLLETSPHHPHPILLPTPRGTGGGTGVDSVFGPALGDGASLAALRVVAGRRARGTRRAEHLLRKVDHFSGRVPQTQRQLDLAGEVLGVDVPEPTIAALDVAD